MSRPAIDGVSELAPGSPFVFAQDGLWGFWVFSVAGVR